MSTEYIFNGTISYQHIKTMKNEVNKKSNKEIGKPLLKFSFGECDYSNVLTITIEQSKDSQDSKYLHLTFDDNSNVTCIHHSGSQVRLIRLIEYFSNVKIWDEYDRFDLENWLGFYDDEAESSIVH